ncbi:transposase [Streptomyces sp. MNU76]|uniref:transposase n=1 Tax=Streptomyces sp. MNU76 TaxID=2560026 RepID=UPI001E614CC4|nr:transposase [Streptomyces sp. MNU76]MCC9711744.1 transposase [Streptomyces sp. MNU76]
MARPSRYPLELRRRAVRMVAEVRDDYPNETAALQAVAEKLDIGSRETLRNWVKQHEIDGGQRPGTTTEESAQLKALKKENAELKRANEILKAAASFFASMSSTGHTHARSVHRRAPGPLRRRRADLQDAHRARLQDRPFHVLRPQETPRNSLRPFRAR